MLVEIVRQGPAVGRLWTLGDRVVIGRWDSRGEGPSRIGARWGGQPIEPPFARVSVACGDGECATVVLFRAPASAAPVAGVAIVDQKGASVAELSAESGTVQPLDLDALFDRIEPQHRVRVLKTVLDFLCGPARGDGSGHVEACRGLIARLSRRPGPLRPIADLTDRLVLCRGQLPAGFGAVTSVIAVGATWVRQVPFPAEPEAGPSKAGFQPFHLVVERGFVRDDTLIVLFGRNGMACRGVVAAAESRPELLPWLEREPAAGAAARSYLLKCLSLGAAIDDKAAARMREIQLCLPLPRRHVADAGKPIAAGIDLAISHGVGGVFAAGWLRDSHGMVEAVRAVSPVGGTRVLDAPMHRFPRDDKTSKGAEGGTGFVMYQPGDDTAMPLYQYRFELLLQSGAVVELVPPLPPSQLAEARSAVLNAIPGPHLTDAALEGCIGPAAARLHAAHLATRRSPEVIVMHDRTGAPRHSVIVPLYRNLDFLRFQMGAFAVDPVMRNAELIYVLDSPEQRGVVEHLLVGLNRLYDLRLKLVVQSANFGFSAANNAGAETAEGERLVFVNSDVIPDRPGWLDILDHALDIDAGVGAVGPKLLFDDQSLQHAGMYFGHDARGRWLNMHYHKGMPRDFPLACTQRPVPAVTGACVMVPKALYDHVGGFCEDYIIGDYEDSDLCLRVRAAGYEIVYVPEAELYHLERQSITQHVGYTRGAACLYNGRLHAQRWDADMTALMARFAPGAAAAGPKADDTPVTGQNWAMLRAWAS
ncbi:MAG TPA: glycosyltransferase family 2 protein [Alphaproteobacteria bacterium]|nr:glycosyltransferase family 2 protein [Alphaproteobacteria bacterium]